MPKKPDENKQFDMFKHFEFTHEQIVRKFKIENKKIIIGYGICLFISFIATVVLGIYAFPEMISTSFGNHWLMNMGFLLALSFTISFVYLCIRKCLERNKLVICINNGEYDFIDNLYVLNLIAIINKKDLKALQDKVEIKRNLK